MKIPNLAKFIGLTLGVALSVFAVSFVTYATWSQPPSTPPTCPSGNPGCDAPVHVGSATQAKSGALGVGGVFQANSSAYLAVNSGSVGIGTASPSEKLTVAGGHGSTKVRLSASGFGQPAASNDAFLSLWASEPGWSYTGAGIGNNILGNPYYGRVNSARGASYIRLLDGSMHFNVVTSGGTNTNAMFVKSDGNVGFGTLDPQSRLDVRRDARFYNSAGNLVLIID